MQIEHQGKRPQVDPSAYIAPTAVLCGDVVVGPHARVLFGAVLTAEGGPLDVGAHTIIMEHAVVRSTSRHPVRLGAHVLVGPRAYLTGCWVDDAVFLATGSTVFNGAEIGTGSEVRINGVVHLRTVLPPGSTVPIGWVAVGEPAEMHPPEAHEPIWARQRELDFPGYVFGLQRAPIPELMPEMTRRYGSALAAHDQDRVLDE